MSKITTWIGSIVLLLLAQNAIAQTTAVEAKSANAASFPLEGFFFENNNRGYLAMVKVEITDETGRVVQEAYSDDDGKFVATLSPNHDYKMKASKNAFYVLDTAFSSKGHQAPNPMYLKYPLQRLPGYIFDATISEQLTDAARAAGTPANAVDSVRVEMYNTTKKISVLDKNTGYTNLFNYTFEQGNHYTIMLRKRGFFTKRIEANINIHGCILCFEGLGSITPGVVDNLTEKNTAGTLGANIQMRRIEVNKSIKVDNIYYDLSRYNIRPDAAKELDKLVVVLKDNPQIVVELSSHTDSRGGANENMTLSENRARAAVDYVVSKGIARARISGKGYGETKLVNGCTDGVQCNEEDHQKNRRTELTVTDVLTDDPFADKSLANILEEQDFMKTVTSDKPTEIIQVGNDGAIPEEIRLDLERQAKREAEAAKKAAEAPAEMPVNTPATTNPETTEKAAPVPIDDTTPPPIDTRSRVVAAQYVESVNDPVALDEGSETEAQALAKTFPITATTNGYKILLIGNDMLLSSKNGLFEEFKNNSIFHEKLNGNHLYLIGNYRSKISAEAMMERGIKIKYRNAKIVHYKDGKQVD